MLLKLKHNVFIDFKQSKLMTQKPSVHPKNKKSQKEIKLSHQKRDMNPRYKIFTYI
ncbi:hypothetical protein XF_0380 [Xylella fastidiosa 9a5c]|uniref:Uncharacterized protein n=1 Tax=Xylella fastidiosa (strain 9a5c) TaxID=160492 RepID=Q9PGC2_XYLFA|nr:hypothetical protein XF_0380 [Xylella fastidiosa 9a5c]